MLQCSQEEKITAISSKAYLGCESCKRKLIKMDRPIKEDEYKAIKQVDPSLLLDTERLIGKLILRGNKDLTSNQRFVLYLMLCCLSDGRKWVNMDYLIGKVTDGIYNQKKIENILKNCEVTIDDCEKKKLFKSQGEEYSIDLTTLIKYTDYGL